MEHGAWNGSIKRSCIFLHLQTYSTARKRQDAADGCAMATEGFSLGPEASTLKGSAVSRQLCSIDVPHRRQI